MISHPELFNIIFYGILVRKTHQLMLMGRWKDSLQREEDTKIGGDYLFAVKVKPGRLE